MEEFVKALEEGNYQKAREGFQRIYDNTHSIIAFYYLTMIDYRFNSLTVKEIISRFEYLYAKGNLQIKNKIIPLYLTFLLFEIDDFKKAYEISKREYQFGNHQELVCFAYGYTLHILKKDNSDRVISIIEEGLTQEGVENQFKLFSYEVIVKIYLARKDIDKAKQILGKLTLIMPQEERLHFINLMINLEEDDSSLDEDSLEIVILSPYVLEFASYISNHFFMKRDFENCIKYIDLIIEKIGPINSLIRKKAICIASVNKFDKALEVLSLGEEDDESLFLKTQILVYKGDRSSLKLALANINELLEKTPSIRKYKSLGDILVKLEDYSKVKELIELLKTKYPNDNYVHVLNAHLHLKDKEFDKAEKEIKKVAGNIEPEYICDLAFSSYKKTSESFFLYKGPLSDNPYLKLIAKYYGEFNQEIQDYQKEFEELDKEKADGCDYALLGNILLNTNKEEAIKYFEYGMNKYKSGNDRCACSLIFYAYCLFKGYGIEKNTKEAYLLLKDIIDNHKEDIEENLGNLLAEISIELDLDLKEVYSFLIDTIERRYSCSRYFTLIKIGKLINENTKKYEKMFKKSLKHCNQREREYYQNNPTEFLMNNN
ncbi:MAG: hypothetical protein E7180_04225 [Erysipelotrichaceae bacterium]|nr:hypothetical protein [Erysipelotrichaceae bacterium]